MNVDPQDLERHYSSLSDSALLDVNRDDLIEIAQDRLDRELARRGLTRKNATQNETAGTGLPWVDDGTGFAVSNFNYPDEAAEARDALEAEGIPCYLTQGGDNLDRDNMHQAEPAGQDQPQGTGSGGGLGAYENKPRRSGWPPLVVLMVPPAYADRALAVLHLEPGVDQPLLSEDNQ
jgi:hypothetical protein